MPVTLNWDVLWFWLVVCFLKDRLTSHHQLFLVMCLFLVYSFSSMVIVMCLILYTWAIWPCGMRKLRRKGHQLSFELFWAFCTIYILDLAFPFCPWLLRSCTSSLLWPLILLGSLSTDLLSDDHCVQQINTLSLGWESGRQDGILHCSLGFPCLEFLELGRQVPHSHVPKLLTASGG